MAMNQQTTSTRPKMSPETRREISKWIVQAALGWVSYGLILFVSAGTIAWVWGWLLLIVLGIFLAAHPIILIPINPDLLVEREKGLREKGVKTWDRWIAALAGGVFPMVSWIVAGLDFRFGWTEPLPLTVHLGGLLGMVLGFALFLWAMAANAFFAEGVRIQTERGHTVATGGPYRYVRHPGYSGAILAMVASPVLLGSPWSLIPAIISAALYVVRTALEDKLLKAELPGYEEYARRTRYRLVPGVW
jgi:protein-S-isoprenylcysteine O-methyltransferase Ste14